MIARKRLHIVVIALCLWLPLQAIAGQWLHCAQLESRLMILDSTLEPTTHSCHEVATTTVMQMDESTQNDSAQNDSTQNKSSSVDTTSCKHCQFSCSWHSALVLREFTPPGIYSSIAYDQFKTPSPAQPHLATPQRPPQYQV